MISLLLRFDNALRGQPESVLNALLVCVAVVLLVLVAVAPPALKAAILIWVALP